MFLRLINLITGGGFVNYFVISVNFIFFYRACQAQGVDRKTLPYCGWFQPYSAYIGASVMLVLGCIWGYPVLRPGGWDVGTFFTYYTMILLAPINFVFWKLVKKSKVVPSESCDLQWELPAIEAHEAEIGDEEKKMYFTKGLQKLGLKRGVA